MATAASKKTEVVADDAKQIAIDATVEANGAGGHDADAQATEVAPTSDRRSVLDETTANRASDAGETAGLSECKKNANNVAGGAKASKSVGTETGTKKAKKVNPVMGAEKVDVDHSVGCGKAERAAGSVSAVMDSMANVLANGTAKKATSTPDA